MLYIFGRLTSSNSRHSTRPRASLLMAGIFFRKLVESEKSQDTVLSTHNILSRSRIRALHSTTIQITNKTCGWNTASSSLEELYMIFLKSKHQTCSRSCRYIVKKAEDLILELVRHILCRGLFSCHWLNLILPDLRGFLNGPSTWIENFVSQCWGLRGSGMWLWRDRKPQLIWFHQRCSLDRVYDNITRIYSVWFDED